MHSRQAYEGILVNKLQVKREGIHNIIFYECSGLDTMSLCFQPSPMREYY